MKRFGIIGLVAATFVIGCEDRSPNQTPVAAASPAGESPAGSPENSAESGNHHHSAHDHMNHKVLPAGDVVPGASLYQLDVSLESQDGAKLRWADLRGTPVVVSMVYSTCTTACPMIVSEILQILEASDAQGHRVLLVSMDPERDDPAALTAMATRHDLPATWTLARPTPEDLPEVAAALGVRYRQLPSGDFNHSQVIALLDVDGVVAARAEGLGPQRDAVVRAIGAHAFDRANDRGRTARPPHADR